MDENKFNKIVCVIMIIGIICTGVLIKYTVDRYKELSITSFISTEEVLHE